MSLRIPFAPVWRDAWSYAAIMVLAVASTAVLMLPD